MNDINFLNLEQEEQNSFRKTYFFQIDFLKAIMILLVIFDHFVTWNIKNEIGVALWERISIPVFLVILGFNLGHSFRGKGDLTLKQLYSWSYFKNKIQRYILPFLILYAASTFIGLFMYGFDWELMYYGQYYPDHGLINLVYLFLPFWGPGNWFIPVLFQSILIAPLLYWAFTKKPIISLILTFVIEIFMQAIVFFLIGEAFTSWEEVHIYTFFSCSILFYLSAVGLGMWFSQGYDLKEDRNFFMWFLYPLSLVYLVIYQFFGFRIRIDGIPFLRGDYHLLVFPYSAFLVLLALKFLPNSSNARISKTISLIGKSTYHILLTQILGYAMIDAYWGTHYGMDTPFHADDIIDLVTLWISFVWLGIIWYKIEHQKDLIRKILYYLNFFILFPCGFLLTFWLQGFWVPISLVIINLYSLAAIILHFVLKRPLNTRIIAIWTGFLVICFISMILQVEIILPSDYWIVLLPIGAYLVIAVTYTISHKF